MKAYVAPNYIMFRDHFGRVILAEKVKTERGLVQVVWESEYTQKRQIQQIKESQIVAQNMPMPSWKRVSIGLESYNPAYGQVKISVKGMVNAH